MKKILLSFALFAVAGAAYVGIKASTANHESSLLLQNVEAMALKESTSDSYDCYSILNGSGQSVVCSTCQLAAGTPPWYHFGSTCKR